MTDLSSASPQTTDSAWASRIGAGAAKTRVTWKRAARAGVVLVIGFVVGLGVAIGIGADDADATVALVATIASIAFVSGIVGLTFLISAYTWHRATIDNAFAHLKRRSPDVTAAVVARIIRSTDVFDSEYTPQRSAEFQDIPVSLPNWTPDIQRPILPGMTEQSLVRIHRVILFIGGLGLVIMAGNGATGHFPGNRVWFTGWGAVCAVLAVSLAFWVAAVAKGRREFLHGYSTAPRGASLPTDRTTRPVDAWSSLDFVDGRTGYLLRQSDEQLLTRPRWAERLRQIRAQHAGESPVRIDRGDTIAP